MKKKFLLITLLAALTFSVAMPSATGTAQAASHVKSHPALFDKTRFALHLGFAYFAFHHFVYNPYRAGSFKAHSSHRTRSILSAGVALLVTYHELKKSYDIAKGSNSGVLHALIKPLNGLINTASRVASKLRGGQYNDNEVKGIVNSANSFSKQATHNGINIRDIPVPGLH